MKEKIMKTFNNVKRVIITNKSLSLKILSALIVIIAIIVIASCFNKAKFGNSIGNNSNLGLAVQSGKWIYYVDIDDTSDTTRDVKYLLEWKEYLDEIDTRDYANQDSLSTPTTVVVRNGKFADAKSGALGLEGGDEYLNFTKFVEGEYIGKIESN